MGGNNHASEISQKRHSLNITPVTGDVVGRKIEDASEIIDWRQFQGRRACRGTRVSLKLSDALTILGTRMPI